jgi:hypothetical protein
MHYKRYQRRGSTDFLPQAERAWPTGGEHPRWKGTEVSYSGAHMRLRDLRGPASEQPCANCGKQARHWAYDHADPDERQSPEGPYSTDPTHYLALCVPCHKKADLAYRDKANGKAA